MKKLKRLIGRNKYIFLENFDINNYEIFSIAITTATKTTQCLFCEKAINIGEPQRIILLLNKKDINEKKEIVKAFISYAHIQCYNNYLGRLK